MEKTMDIHVALPSTLMTRLNRLSRQLEVRRAELLRRAVSEFLDRLEAERIRQEMEEYVEQQAPHSADFVKETDSHTVKRLLRETKW